MVRSLVRGVLWLTLGLAVLPHDSVAVMVYSTPPVPPRSQPRALPERVFRFVLLGPPTAAKTAAAVIVEISDHCWTAREFGEVEVLLPAAATPELAASGGVALWNATLKRFEAIGLER
jgi:hypothetical protein